jgi:hypothetical protein
MEDLRRRPGGGSMMIKCNNWSISMLASSNNHGRWSLFSKEKCKLGGKHFENQIFLNANLTPVNARCVKEEKQCVLVIWETNLARCYPAVDLCCGAITGTWLKPFNPSATISPTSDVLILVCPHNGDHYNVV